MEENEVTLRNLPRTLLIEVFKLLDSKTRGRCTAVCRDWLAIVSLPECWRRLDLPLQPGDNLHTVFTRGKQPWPALWEQWLGDAVVYHCKMSLSGESPLMNCIDITGQSANKGMCAPGWSTRVTGKCPEGISGMPRGQREGCPRVSATLLTRRPAGSLLGRGGEKFFRSRVSVPPRGSRGAPFGFERPECQHRRLVFF